MLFFEVKMTTFFENVFFKNIKSGGVSPKKGPFLGCFFGFDARHSLLFKVKNDPLIFEKISGYYIDIPCCRHFGTF
jgi:hypothetical protein